MAPSRKPFLTAGWRDLVLLNYEVPRGLLAPLVPAGTELEDWDGRFLASVVGFRFVDTKIGGWPVPFHRHFEEVNLRFYVVRRTESGERRRGVVFVRELVPKFAVAWLARLLYNEPYQRVSMTHRVERPDPLGPPTSVSYRWRWNAQLYQLSGELLSTPTPPARPSEPEFITEHYWGYTRQRDGGTTEYQVQHPSWAVCTLTKSQLTGDITALYGPEWQPVLSGAPRSAFYATGSDVAVFSGQRIPTDPSAKPRNQS